eukprot:Ihof_evm3s419 gene=Ihof_evmTU3s419
MGSLDPKDLQKAKDDSENGASIHRVASVTVFEMDATGDLASNDVDRKSRRQTISNLTKDITLQRIQQEKKVVIFMSGLPARGKSFISKKLARYLRWMGYNCQVFNVGNLRRIRKHTTNQHNANFFDPSNECAKQQRDQLAMDVLAQALDWLHNEGGQLAIHDATNSTRTRRRVMYDLAKQSQDVQVIFIESICNDPKVIERNILLKLKSPDYIDMDPEKALADFTERLRNYEHVYEPICDEEKDYPYIKVIDVGKKIVAHKIRSYLPGQICFYLMNMHLNKRPIWLTRHGESMYNTQGRIGGDSELSAKGHKYAKAFAEFIQEQVSTMSPLHLDEHINDEDDKGQSRNLMPPRSATLLKESPQQMKIKKKTNDIYITNKHKDDKGEANQTLDQSNDDMNATNHKDHVPAQRAYSLLGQYQDEKMLKCAVRLRRDRTQSESHLPVVTFTPGGSPHKREVVVWTSTLQRAIGTCSYLPPSYIYNQTAMLNEIFAGQCEGMSYGRIMHEYPCEFLARAQDKLHYRYPGSGESYIDIVERVRPLIIEIERCKNPVVIVGHMSTLRALYAYFMNIPLDQVPYIEMSLNTTICLAEHPHGMEEKVYQWREDPLKPDSSIWEYIPDYFVHAHRSDSKAIHCVTTLGHEYCGIPEEEFRQFREELAK